MESKTVKVKHVTLVRKEVEKEYVLSGEKMFVQSWNFREVIGIYPKYYDHGNGNSGFLYNIRFGKREVGLPTTVFSFDMYSSYFNEMHENDRTITAMAIVPELNALIRRIFTIVCLDTDYSAKISEQTFEDYYTAMISEMSMDNIRIQFQREKDWKNNYI